MRRKTLELGITCPVRWSDRLTLERGGRRWTARNVITDEGMHNLRSYSLTALLEYIGLVRKINPGWEPTAEETAATLAGALYSIEVDGQTRWIQDSWIEAYRPRTGISISWGPGNAYIDLAASYTIPPAGVDVWTPATTGPSFPSYGTPVYLGGSNEGPWEPPDIMGYYNGGCFGTDKDLHAFVLAGLIERATNGAAYYHNLQKIWSLSWFKDEYGDPFTLGLEGDPEYEFITLTYTFRLQVPTGYQEESVGGYTIRTYPVGWNAAAFASSWSPVYFPNYLANAAAFCRESASAPSFSATIPSDGIAPSSVTQLGSGSYYRDVAYRWNPAVANFGTGVGQIYHGQWGNGYTRATVFVGGKALKTELDKLVLEVRYSWERESGE
jgi:hypothetical protein